MGQNDTTKIYGWSWLRDFEIFNLALLARQTWRILQAPDSLISCIVKPDYFPSCSILDAQLGSHPSRIWRAIIKGCDVLCQGLIRRICDGSGTHIWNHNWLPRDELMMPSLSHI